MELQFRLQIIHTDKVPRNMSSQSKNHKYTRKHAPLVRNNHKKCTAESDSQRIQISSVKEYKIAILTISNSKRYI